MPEASQKTIAIFDVSEVVEQTSYDPQGQPRVLRSGVKDKVAKLVETSVEEMSKNMAKFVGGVSEMLSAGVESAGDFEIDTVEVECLISGSGQIGLAGSSLGIQGGSTLKIVFTRRKENTNG